MEGHKEKLLGTDSTNVTPKGKSSFFNAVYSVICTVVGVGVIGLPYGLQQSSWYGIITMVIVWIVATYTAVLLSRPFVEDPKLQTYSDLSRKALGRTGFWIAMISQTASLMGVSIIYLIIAGLFLSEILGYLEAIQWTLICAAVLVPFCYLRTLHETAYMALFGVITSMIAIVCIIVGVILSEPTNAPTYGDVSIGSFMESFAKFAFAFAGHMVFPSIQKVMKAPSRFSIAVSLSLSFVFVVYIVVAILSYSIFGQNTSQNIFSNITSPIPRIIGQSTIICHLLFAFVVIMNPVFMNIEKYTGLGPEVSIFRGPIINPPEIPIHEIVTGENIQDNLEYGTIKPSKMASIDQSEQHLFERVFPTGCARIALIVFYLSQRTFVVGFVAFVAVLIPFFTELMELVGGTTTTLMTFIMPIVINFCLYRKKMYWFEIVIGMVIIVFAAGAGLSASFYAVSSIIKDSSHYTIF